LQIKKEKMKEQIIEILGKNHTTPIQFDEVNGFYGLYTYRNGVYVFKNGQDIDYDDIGDSDKNKILNVVFSKKWKLNKSLN
jgi:outer membrane protein assembly factor BamE (lipoprotein component of BamABCDE complex)